MALLERHDIPVCRLQIIPLRAQIAYKIHFQRNSFPLSFRIDHSDFNITDINKESAMAHLIKDDILHKMVLFGLAERQDSIPEPHVLEIILVRQADVFLSLDVIALGFLYQVSAFKISDIFTDSLIRNIVQFLH